MNEILIVRGSGYTVHLNGRPVDEGANDAQC